jgi:hypothetical protein
MKKYKVLTKIGNEYFSPFQDFKYGKLEDFINKEMTTICDLSNKECSFGFYATDVEGIVYSYNCKEDNVVFEVEVDGNKEHKIFNEYKQRFSAQKFIREIPLEELKELIKNQSDKMDWNYYESVFPIDVRNVNKNDIVVTNEVIMLLKEWDSIRDSVWYSVVDSVWDSVWSSVWNPVWDSVRDSVWDSVWDSVRDSVWDSVWDSVRSSVSNSVGAYIGSLFPNITKWKGIDHKEGIYPFESCAKLWKIGFVPTFDGEIWRLHQGENMKVVFEIDKNELLKY